MSLTKKTLMVFGVLLVMVVYVTYFISSSILNKSFAQLEEQKANADLDRVEATFQGVIDNLHTKTTDWADWDDNYVYIQNRNKDFEASNMEPATIKAMMLDVMLFFDITGDLVWGKAVDWDQASFKDLPGDLVPQIKDKKLLFSASDQDKSYSGLLLLKENVFIFSSRPILKTGHQGEVKGTLIFGKFLKDSIVEDIKNKTRLELKMTRVNQMPEAMKDEEIREGMKHLFDLNSETTLKGELFFKDVTGVPVVFTELFLPRDIYQQGQHTLSYINKMLVVCLITFVAVLILFLNSSILSRLKEMKEIASEIKGDSLSPIRFELKGNDEITGLAHILNLSLDRVQENYQVLELKNKELQELYEEFKKTQQQLLHSQKLESLGKLAGGIAHDFNNILAAILGYTSLLEEDLKNDEKSMKKLKVIHQSIDRATSLVRQMLSFSRQQKSIEKKKVILNDVILESEKMISLSPEKVIHFVNRFEDELWPMVIDPTQMTQVLLNLGVNARDAIKSEGTITFETTNEEVSRERMIGDFKLTPGKYVKVSVRDTGMGMDAAVMEKIFDPFYTTKEVGKGSGLGLSTVYGIIQSNGGAIEVSSEIGVGTCFYIYLPASFEEILPVSSNKRVKEELDLTGKRILVADDEEMIREYVTEFLKKKGAQLFIACDGEEAVRLARTHLDSIDLVISDLRMPKKDGLSVINDILRIKPDLKAIFISGFSARMDEMKSVLKDGQIMYLPKPFPLTELEQTIKYLLI